MRTEIKVSLEEAISRLLEHYVASSMSKQESCRKLADSIIRECSQQQQVSIPAVYEALIGVPAFTSPLTLPFQDRWKAGFIINIYRIMKGKEPEKRPAYFCLASLSWWHELVEEYYEWMRTNCKSVGTINTRNSTLIYFLDFIDSIGIRDISQLGLQTFEDFVLFLGKQDYTGWTKATILYTLRDFVKFLMEKELLRFSPLVMISGFRQSRHNKIPKFYTPEEVMKL